MKIIKKENEMQKSTLLDLLKLVDTIKELEKNYCLDDLVDGINYYRSVTPKQALFIIRLAKFHSIELNPNPLYGNINVEGWYCEQTIQRLNEKKLKLIVPLLTKEQGVHVSNVIFNK